MYGKTSSKYERNGKKHLSVLEFIKNTIDKNITVVSDMTQLACTTVEFLPMNQPKQWFVQRAMVLPAGIDMTLARQSLNDKDSGAWVAGDIGFQCTLQEMALAAELDLNIVVLL